MADARIDKMTIDALKRPAVVGVGANYEDVHKRRVPSDLMPVYNQQMTDRAQSLLREALTLPVAERADVAAELLASLNESEDPADVRAAWAKEIERRARRVLAGESSGEPWSDVRDRVVNRLRQR